MTPKVLIDHSRCKGCGLCIQFCPKRAISRSDHVNDKGYLTVEVDQTLCICCGSCYRVCPDCVFTVQETEVTPHD